MHVRRSTGGLGIVVAQQNLHRKEVSQPMANHIKYDVPSISPGGVGA